jgi:leucine-rich repeat protein SHOC2
VLYLDNNQLSSLPPDIGNLSNLQGLYLSNNRLNSLPSEIGNLNNLCVLDLRDNRFQNIPLELRLLKQMGSFQGCELYVYNRQDVGFFLDKDSLDSLPEEVQNGETTSLLNYLENIAWWHLQRLLIGIASAVGFIALFILGWRWRYRLSGKTKKKRDAD